MTSDSLNSTTPVILTPDSTGTNATNLTSSPESSGSANINAIRKARRQTAFYPNVNSSNKAQKPFSRSAAKRESVMALGSIEHLQYYFTKTGLQAKKKPQALDKPHYGVVPAIGGELQIHTNTSVGSVDLKLPPTPVIPSPVRPSFPQVPKTYEVDPESLLPGVIEDLTVVSRVWRIDADSSRSGPDNPVNTNYFDVLGALQATTRAIRSVRNYVVSLPDESVGNIGELFRSNRLTAAVAGRRVSSSSTSASSTSASTSSATLDPLALIRRSALEVLTVLRDLEERYRLPLTDDAYDAQSDSGGGSRRVASASERVASPSGVLDELEREHTEAELEGLHEVDADTSVAFSLVRVQGRDESVPVWENEDNDEFNQEESQKKEGWDERLVLGSGWLYRQDVILEELEKERRVVGGYLDVVDEVLFSGQKGDHNLAERGWMKEKAKIAEKRRSGSRVSKARRTSAGDAEGRSLGLGFTFPEAGGRRRVSTGMINTMMESTRLSEEPSTMEGITEADEEEEPENGQDGDGGVEDDDLPEWAKRNAFLENPLDRCHALISSLLPSTLQSALVPEDSSRLTFLDCLSSGQLLCAAYNAGVRKSKEPWGYVNKDGIHDIIALEQAAAEAGDSGSKAKTGWTFRRSDNLRLWVGALKLRYMLPIVTPAVPAATGGPNLVNGSTTPASSNTPATSPLPQPRKFTTNEPPIVFDAKIVAKKDDGWEDMLEAVLLRWMWRVVDERRSNR
ncbi:hypothetical protein Moror_2780 [Moniliophthora roreri MCA 2997]|uniref:Uncharacterized protein n=2 Tax=Moniliophthora roreri TaxID=221103 RepID=V2XC75_MONRO|nr:hypothetical protein Moror_2780 [Moniliophthora roreri MCA 2997]KAI3598111.1 hypothetical protein WG66_009114 [Moniliophthora roreri]